MAAQAYLLPALGTSLDDTSIALGRDRFWVSRARNRFLKGLPPLKHGGRRNELFSEVEEVEIVKLAFIKARGRIGERVSLRDTLRALLDDRLGHAVSDSTITEMLARMLRRYVPEADMAFMWRLEGVLGLLFSAEEDVRSRIAALRTREESKS